MTILINILDLVDENGKLKDKMQNQHLPSNCILYTTIPWSRERLLVEDRQRLDDIKSILLSHRSTLLVNCHNKIHLLELDNPTAGNIVSLMRAKYPNRLTDPVVVIDSLIPQQQTNSGVIHIHESNDDDIESVLNAAIKADPQATHDLLNAIKNVNAGAMIQNGQKHLEHDAASVRKLATIALAIGIAALLFGTLSVLALPAVGVLSGAAVGASTSVLTGCAYAGFITGGALTIGGLTGLRKAACLDDQNLVPALEV